MLFRVTPTDPGTYLSLTIAVVGVALLACLVPARRAIRLDPAKVLRMP